MTKKFPVKKKPAPAVALLTEARGEKRLKFFFGLFIAVFAFLLYAKSISYNYTLDDHPAIDENKFTTRGIAGIPKLLTTDYWFGYKDEVRGPIYRPMSLMMFAVEWQFFPRNPHINHFMTVFLYALTCWLLFLILCKLKLPFSSPAVPGMKFLFPFICMLLYAAHPIHTEVVNTIKSRDDVACFLFAALSILFFLKYISAQSLSSLIAGSVFFFLSMLSKETGITFLLIIPLLIFVFTGASSKLILKVTGMLSGVALLYLFIRMQVIESVPKNPQLISPINNMLYAAPDFQSRQATAFYILLKYLQLLVFPHPLTCDYNFSQIKIQRFDSVLPVLSLLLHLALTVYAVIKIRKRSIVAFSILFYFVTLSPVSNILFIGGSSMAERFMYIPSFGFCLVVTFGMFKFLKTDNKITGIKKLIIHNALLAGVVFIITGLYLSKTISRSKYWKDNFTIYSVDVKTSPNSVTANKIFGSSLVAEAQKINNFQQRIDTFRLAVPYLKRAIEIYPYYTEVYRIIGFAYFSSFNYDSAFYFFREGLKFKPDDMEMNFNASLAKIQLQKFDEAIPILKHLTSVFPNHEEGFYNLALCYTNKGDYDAALPYYQKVNQLNPNRGDAYFYEGKIYEVKGDATKSAAFYKRAADLGYPVPK